MKTTENKTTKTDEIIIYTIMVFAVIGFIWVLSLAIPKIWYYTVELPRKVDSLSEQVSSLQYLEDKVTRLDCDVYVLKNGQTNADNNPVYKQFCKLDRHPH